MHSNGAPWARMRGMHAMHAKLRQQHEHATMPDVSAVDILLAQEAQSAPETANTDDSVGPEEFARILALLPGMEPVTHLESLFAPRESVDDTRQWAERKEAPLTAVDMLLQSGRYPHYETEARSGRCSLRHGRRAGGS
eukprot:scaffold2801_cov266-Pinguiococcus_pyrenoidosus.AAC.1